MYIIKVSEENKNYYISLWILLITSLVVLMIIVGGLTRLTDSGLSITKWDLFIGILPPLSISDWNTNFDLYKQIPEYQILNTNMTLDEFKFIFWWEYIHRFLGRLIGIAYLIPLIYFTYKKFIPKENINVFYLIFLLILLQGFVGWYMVKSGLTERTDVSHYRLSLHLTIAFIIYILLIWNFLKYTSKNYIKYDKSLPFNLSEIFFILIFIQISLGAFVSGLDAGQIYNTWPLMNLSYFPDDSKIMELFTLKTFSEPSLVQFLHRNLAYLIFFVFLIIVFIILTVKKLYYLKKTIFFISIFLLLQIFVGILTILSGGELIYSSLHQVGSIFLLTSALTLVFKSSKLTDCF